MPIRNVPEGQCTYGCVYCCLGGTPRLRTRPRPFHPVDDVAAAVREQLARSAGMPRAPDHLTFVHGGEPTLDSHLGAAIERLAGIDLPVVVMTNASLLWRPEVRTELLPADQVMIKVDTVDRGVWRRMNRPARQLRLERILDGIRAFREEFSGRLDTETAVVPGLNDDRGQLERLAAFLEVLAPTRAYVVVRPTETDRMGAAEVEAVVRESLAEVGPELIRPGGRGDGEGGVS